MILEDDHYCFACGQDNSKGLCIQWKVVDRTTFAEFVPQREHQGWKNIVHGGILATLLDEAMTRLAWIVCGGALTAEMSVRYLVPARVGEKLSILGAITKENRKLIELKSFLYKGESDSIPEIQPFNLNQRKDLSFGLQVPKPGVLVAKAQGKAIKL